MCLRRTLCAEQVIVAACDSQHTNNMDRSMFVRVFVTKRSVFVTSLHMEVLLVKDLFTVYII